MRHSQKVDEAFVEGLGRLIKEQELPLLNGYHKKNNVQKEGYSLLVWYESGEMLLIGAEGDAADTCIFEIQPFLDYADKLEMKSFVD